MVPAWVLGRVLDLVGRGFGRVASLFRPLFDCVNLGRICFVIGAEICDSALDLVVFAPLSSDGSVREGILNLGLVFVRTARASATVSLFGVLGSCSWVLGV